MSRRLLFDLDNTLYDPALGVVDRIDRRINAFMIARLGIGEDEVDRLRLRYWAEHGTTLRGLVRTHRIDPDEFLDFVHDIEVADLVLPDSRLGRLLDGLDDAKVVFSNASRRHAARVLERLAVGARFERVFALEDLDYVPKPVPDAYATLLSVLGADAGDCVLVEDTARNLAPAKALGMTTVWVTAEGTDGPGIDHVIRTIYDLAEVLR